MCTIVGKGFCGVRVSAMDRPMVQRITQQEIVKVLPWSGSGARLRKEVGTAEACTIRVAASLVACALIYQNSVEVASAAALYWAWGPIWSTVLSNSLLRLRYRYAGIWTARVLEVRILPAIESPEEGEDLLGGIFSKLPVFYPTLQIVMGDDSPAAFQMDVVITEEVPRVKVGERVEVLVMSDRPGLSRFKAVRDVYFPDREVWLSEEPYIEREFFERLLRKLPGPAAPKREKQVAVGIRPEKIRPGKLYLNERSTSREGGKWVKAVKTGPPKTKQVNLFDEEEFVMDYREDEVFQIGENRELARPFGTEQENDKQRQVQELEERNM